MRNRKTFIGIVLLIVVLLLGIAYAAITDSLTISGTAKATTDDANFKVVFTGETTPATSTDGVTATATADTTSATLNVEGLTTGGQTKSATFKVKNASDELKALLAVKTSELTGENAEFFKVTTTIADEDATLDATGETDVTVTVELVKTPIEAVSATINVELSATAVLAD